MEFESREHALNWIINNQLGRRNLTPNQSKYLWGLRFSNEKLIKTDNLKKGDVFPKAQNGLSGDTAQKIADEYGIGRNTVKRAEKFAKAIDILPPDIKQSVLRGEDTIQYNDADSIINMPKPIQKKFIQEVEQGTPIKEAVKKVDPEQKRKYLFISPQGKFYDYCQTKQGRKHL